LVPLKTFLDQPNEKRQWWSFGNGCTTRGYVPTKEGQDLTSQKVLDREIARGFEVRGLYLKRLEYFVDGLAIGAEQFIRDQLVVRPRTEAMLLSRSGRLFERLGNGDRRLIGRLCARHPHGRLGSSAESSCGVYGLRPFHGRIPLDGVIPDTPTFDSVCWFAREVGVHLWGKVMLHQGDTAIPPHHLVIADDTFDVANLPIREDLKSSVDAATVDRQGHAR